PRSELDATVAALAESLRRKLPETIRYTKAQLNWWRDLVWSQTITHARDWLAVHSGSDEVREAVSAFHEKRAPEYEALRTAATDGGRACPSCGERGLSARYEYCPMCGAGLTALQEGVP
ncbi:MAG TPA: hypothetical protein VHK28_08750, partial [Candidatus Limnocylindria bacterium]|nr:hypothetical protein [Candidatus Limnocylindria bacterium]